MHRFNKYIRTATHTALILLLAFAGVYAAVPSLVRKLIPPTFRAFTTSRSHSIIQEHLLDRSGRVRTALFSPEGNIKEVLLALIDSEQQRISLASYVITDRDIATHLIAAHHRGALVEILTCRSGAKDPWTKVPQLIAAGIPVYIYPSEFTRSIMHNKFVLFDSVLDRRIVMTGSFNMTKSAATVNCENAVFLDAQKQQNKPSKEEDIPLLYRNEFERIKRQSIRASDVRTLKKLLQEKIHA